MRRVKVTYRPQAISDLQGIYRIIAEASQSDVVASGFVQRIMARCRKIGDVPNGGRPRDDLEIVFFDSDQWPASTVGIKVLQMDLRNEVIERHQPPPVFRAICTAASREPQLP